MRPKTASHFSHWVSIFRSFVTHFICVFFSCRCCHFFSFLLWNRIKFRTKPNAALYSFPHFNHTHIKIIIAAFFFLLTYLHTQNSQATILIKFNLSISLLLVKCTCCSFRFFFPSSLEYILFEIRQGSYDVQFRAPYEWWWWTQMIFSLLLCESYSRNE